MICFKYESVIAIRITMHHNCMRQLPTASPRDTETDDKQRAKNRSTYHPLRLQLDLILSQMKVRETQVFVCSRVTVHRWMRLGLKLKIGEKNSCKVQFSDELSPVPSRQLSVLRNDNDNTLRTPQTY